MAFDELRFVEWLREACALQPGIQLGVGDDMAVLAAGGGHILVASDMLLDSVHFDSRQHSMEAIGRKAIARNLSDCAAMAVKPVAATVSVAFPRVMDEPAAKRLFCGMMEIAADFELAIAGGDTARWDHPLAIDVAIVAEPYAGVLPVPRSGALAGDRLYVSGELGGSILGRHMTFTPRVREARELAEHLGSRLHAMIDISDGLALDLWRMCQASGVGARLEEELTLRLAHPDARRAAKSDGKPLIEHVLGDGEDHELLLAIEGEAGDVPVRLLPVGRVVAKKQLIMQSDAGESSELEPSGFVHR